MHYFSCFGILFHMFANCFIFSDTFSYFGTLFHTLAHFISLRNAYNFILSVHFHIEHLHLRRLDSSLKPFMLLNFFFVVVFSIWTRFRFLRIGTSARDLSKNAAGIPNSVFFTIDSFYLAFSLTNTQTHTYT